MKDNLQKLNIKNYEHMTKKYSKNSALLKHCVFAFLIGGALCVVAKLFFDFITCEMVGSFIGEISEKTGKTMTTMFMVFLGVFLTALNVYDDIGNIAGAGTVVPITGFANSITSPALEYKSEGRILGVGAQMFQVAGPVIVYGTAAAVLAGLVYYFIK